MVRWASQRVANDRLSIIYADLPEIIGSEKPPAIDGHCPDFYCESRERQETLLGEAKTAHDLEARHTRDQLAAYLRYLAPLGNGILIIAVPWRCVPSAKSLVRSLQRQSGCTTVATHFLEQLPG